MSRATQIERIIAKGQLVPLVFVQDAVAASQSDARLAIIETNDGTTESVSAVNEYVMPFDFSVVAITVESSVAAAGSNLTVEPAIDGTVKTTPAATLTSAGSDTSARGTALRDAVTGVAGGRVGAAVTTAAGWTATTADIAVVVWVLVHIEGI